MKSYLSADLVDFLGVLPQFGRQLVVVTDLELQQRNALSDGNGEVTDNGQRSRVAVRAWA